MFVIYCAVYGKEVLLVLFFKLFVKKEAIICFLSDCSNPVYIKLWDWKILSE